MKRPREIHCIMTRLESAGYESFLVGGAVRDALLGKEPKDYDIATNALPDKIFEIFSDKTVFKEGKKFGTIGILTEIGTVEVTTYRIDGDYIDGRKPKDVAFTRNIVEDLARRDFTINAMAYHPKKGLIDPFGGEDDLRHRRLKAVGKAEERFREDALRILRAFRFMGALDFTMAEDVEEAIKAHKEMLNALSAERIQAEMNKIMLQQTPSKVFYAMESAGVLGIIFPELMCTVGYDQRSPYHDKTLFDHILCVVDHAPPKLALRYAALFHDIKKPDTLTIGDDGKGHFFGHDILGAKAAKEILKRLKENKTLIEEVSVLIKEHMKVHDVMSDKALRRQIRRVGEDYILDLYDLMAADMACTWGARDISFIRKRKARIKDLMEKGVPKRSDLAIDGNDLKAAGMLPGPLMGKILKEMEEMLLDDPEENNKADWLEYALKRYEEERDRQ